MFARSNLLVFFLLLTACACTGVGETPGKFGASSDVVGVLREVWRRETRSLLLGEVRFYHQLGPQQQRRWIDGLEPLEQHKRYQAFEKKGLIRFESERDLAGQNFSGWNDFFTLTQSGIRRISTVAVTAEGERLGEVRSSPDGGRKYVVFTVGAYSIDTIVSDEPMDVNGEKFRLVLGTHTFKPAMEFEAILEEAGVETYEERRFRVLFKHDPIASDDARQWMMQRVDIGPRNTDFRTRNVPTAIANLRLGGSR